MAPNEKGYDFTILLYGSFATVSLQKTLRDLAAFDTRSPAAPTWPERPA